MKNLKIRFLPILFVFTSLFNTAFIIQSTTNIEQKTPFIRVEAPPQYKSQKLSFFDCLILKRILKKYKPNQTIDLDRAVNDAKKIAQVGLALTVLSVLMFFVPFGGFFLSVLMSITSIVFGIIAISRANFVLNHPEVTGIQEEGAKKARTNGYCGLIAGTIVAVLIALLLRFIFRNL